MGGLAGGVRGRVVGLGLVVRALRLLVRGLGLLALGGRGDEDLRGFGGLGLRGLLGLFGGGLRGRGVGLRLVGLVERLLGLVDLLQRLVVRGLGGTDLVDVVLDHGAVDGRVVHGVVRIVGVPVVEVLLRERVVIVGFAVAAVGHAGGDVVRIDDVEVVADLVIQVRILPEHVVRGQAGEVGIVAGLHGRVVGLLLHRVPTIVRIVIGEAPVEILADVVVLVVVLVVAVGRVVGLDHGHGQRGLRHLQRLQPVLRAQLVALVDHVQGLEQVVEAGRIVLRADMRVFEVLGDAGIGQILVRLLRVVGLEPAGRALRLLLGGLVRGLLRILRGLHGRVVRGLRRIRLPGGLLGGGLRVSGLLVGLGELALGLVVRGLGLVERLVGRGLVRLGLVERGLCLVGLRLRLVGGVVRLVELLPRVVGLRLGLVGRGFRGRGGDGGLGLRLLRVLDGLAGLLGGVLRLLDLGGIVRVARQAGGLVELRLRLVALRLRLVRGLLGLVGLRLSLGGVGLLGGGVLVELRLVGRVDLCLSLLGLPVGLLLGLGGVVADGLAVVHGLLEFAGVLRGLVGLLLRLLEIVPRLAEAVLRLLDAGGGLLHVPVLVDGVLDVLLGLLHVLLGLVDLLLGLLHVLLRVLHAGVGLVEAVLGIGDLLLGGGHLILLRALLGRGLVDRFLRLDDGLLGLFDRRDRGLVRHGRCGDGARDRHGCDRDAESLLVHICLPSNAVPSMGSGSSGNIPATFPSNIPRAPNPISASSACRPVGGGVASHPYRLPHVTPSKVSPSVRVSRTGGFSSWTRRPPRAVPRAVSRRTRDRGACPACWSLARPRDRARRPACSRVRP